MTDQDNTAVADRPEQEPERVGKYTPPREAVVDLIRKRLTDRLQDVEGGSWDGGRVVTAKDIDEALAEPLPPASLHSAEIRTPGWVTVAAVCPRCGIPNNVGLDLTAEERTDSSGTELHVKGKSKPRTHVCGQTTIEEIAAGDQASFELSDIVGAAQEAIDTASDQGDTMPEPPICTCGKPKVEAPDGRWVCTNPEHKGRDR